MRTVSSFVIIRRRSGRSDDGFLCLFTIISLAALWADAEVGFHGTGITILFMWF